MNKKWDTADVKFSITRQVANLVFGSDAGEKKALALNGNRAKPLHLWLRQAKKFARIALAEKPQLLEKLDITIES